jgi:hypothetical protein
MVDEYKGIPINRLRVDERFWPKGSSEVVRRWIAEDYDAATMPPLVVAEREDGYSVLGWEAAEDEETLFFRVFGRDMNEDEVAKAREFAAEAHG